MRTVWISPKFGFVTHSSAQSVWGGRICGGRGSSGRAGVRGIGPIFRVPRKCASLSEVHAPVKWGTSF